MNNGRLFESLLTWSRSKEFRPKMSDIKSRHHNNYPTSEQRLTETDLHVFSQDETGAKNDTLFSSETVTKLDNHFWPKASVFFQLFFSCIASKFGLFPDMTSSATSFNHKTSIHNRM